MKNFIELNHPLISHDLGIMRDKDSSPAIFRQALKRITYQLFITATQELNTKDLMVETPLAVTKEKSVVGDIWLIPVLRAGLGMVDACWDIYPDARVGVIGLYRDEKTLMPQPYYQNLPTFKALDTCFIIDPMLATGGSALAAIEFVKQKGAQTISLLALISAPEGLKIVHDAHPDVRLVSAKVDEKLNQVGYIVPGLGDAGDRIFGS